MTTDEAIGQGNAFVLRAVAAVAVIQFFIVPPQPADQRRVNQAVGEVLNRLEEDRREFTAVLRDTKDEISAALRPGAKGRDIAHLKARALDMRGKLIANWKDVVILEKSRIVRQLRIPTTDFALGETNIRTLYPLALLAGLVTLARHRKRLLELMSTEPRSIPTPFWAAPIPLGEQDSLSRWIIMNTAGLLLVAVTLHLFLIMCQRDEFFWGIGPIVGAIGFLMLVAYYAVEVCRVATRSLSATSRPPLLGNFSD